MLKRRKLIGLAECLEQSHQVTNRGHARRMAVFGPGIRLRASHLYLSDLWLWCEDGVIGHTGTPLSEPMSSVGSYGACLPESLFLQGCLEAAGLSVYLPPHLSQPSTPLLVSFHRQQICWLPLETRPDSPGEPGMQPRDPCLPWRGKLVPGHTLR